MVTRQEKYKRMYGMVSNGSCRREPVCERKYSHGGMNRKLGRTCALSDPDRATRVAEY